MSHWLSRITKLAEMECPTLSYDRIRECTKDCNCRKTIGLLLRRSLSESLQIVHSGIVFKAFGIITISLLKRIAFILTGSFSCAESARKNGYLLFQGVFVCDYFLGLGVAPIK